LFGESERGQLARGSAGEIHPDDTPVFAQGDAASIIDGTWKPHAIQAAQ